MKYLLLFFITFNIQAETWIVTTHNELTDAYYACHPDNEKDGNGCIKFQSENKVDQFILEHENSWGEKERWLKEHELRPELIDRIKDKKEVFPESLLTKVKRMIGIKIPIKESWMEYLVKADYFYEKKDITKEIEKIEEDKQKEKERIEKLKKIDIDNMTDNELKSILKHLVKEIK